MCPGAPSASEGVRRRLTMDLLIALTTTASHEGKVSCSQNGASMRLLCIQPIQQSRENDGHQLAIKHRQDQQSPAKAV